VANAGSKHGFGALSLTQIGFVSEVVPRRPKRKPVYLVTEAFDAFDLPPHERMADRRIEIAQVSEAHSHSAVGWSPRRHSKGAAV
jgi:hypothetical protein